MESRVCRKCKATKPLDEFYKREEGSYRTDCKECTKAASSAYSKAHPEKHRATYLRKQEHYKAASRARYRSDPQRALAYGKRVRKRNRDFINAAKQVPCADCNTSYPTYVMDFDHVRGKKHFNLSKAAAAMTSLEEIAAEIAKCDVVCANCHRERTHGLRKKDS